MHILHRQDTGHLFIIVFHFGPNLAFASRWNRSSLLRAAPSTMDNSDNLFPEYSGDSEQFLNIQHKICWIHLCRWKSFLFLLWACLIGSLGNFFSLVRLQNWEEKRKKSCQTKLHIVVHIWFWQQVEQDYRTMCMICNCLLLIRWRVSLAALAYRRCYGKPGKASYFCFEPAWLDLLAFFLI